MLTVNQNSYVNCHPNRGILTINLNAGLCQYEIRTQYRYPIFLLSKIGYLIPIPIPISDMPYFETIFEVKKQNYKTQRCNLYIMQLLLVWYIPTLTSIDHCNISLSTITPML